MVEALEGELGGDPEIVTMDFDWAREPHVDVAEVEEAAGSEEEIIARGEGAEVIVTQLAPITQKVLGSLESLHARLTDETRGLIGAEQIAGMPEGSVLINTARGGLLDYEALCDALESRHLGAAALDIYDEEPPPAGSRLFKVPNLVLSPHITGATRETAHRTASTPQPK